LLFFTMPCMYRRMPAIIVLALLLVIEALAQTPAVKAKARKAAPATTAPAAGACAACIRAEENFLASDAMRGRGSGTHDEELAATYVGTELARYGISPAGDNGTY